MKLSNKTYDILKWMLFTLVPELVTLIGALGIIWKVNTEVIVLTIGVIASFIGAITGISNHNYNKKVK